MSVTAAPPRSAGGAGGDLRATDTAPSPAEPASLDDGRGLVTLLTVLFGLFGWIVGLERLSDNSFFWHLRTGEWILDHGIPHGDVFSYTAPGHRWVAQSWLAELTYGGIDRLVGPFGIRVLSGLVGAAVAVLAFRLSLRLARSRRVACGLTIAALAGVFTLWSARPLVIGVLFLVVLLWVVEVPDSAVGRHPLVVLPILFWLWANVHGSFALGFAYLALHLLGGWVDHRRPWEARERTLLVGAAIAFVVVFANPYGAELVLFPIALLARGDILSHIVEWQSPDFREIFGLALAVWIGVFVWAVARGRNGVSRRDLIVTLPFLFLALWALRNIAVAPLVGLPVASRALARDPRPLAFRRSFLALTSAVIVLVAAVVGMSAAAEPDFRLGSYPVGAMRYLERHDLLGRRLLLDDADAGYAILAYFPAQRIFIDDRYDMYPSSVINDYFDLAAADRDWSRILDRRGVDVVVWERDDPLAVLLDTSPTWARVHRDGSRAVWVRQS